MCRYPFTSKRRYWLQVTCPQLIDYRFVAEDPPNLIVAARMLNADNAELDWTAWVLVKENSYLGLPSYVPIPTPDQLPDSVKPWLEETDCCQILGPDCSVQGRLAARYDDQPDKAGPRRLQLLLHTSIRHRFTRAKG